jgi:hypothetical protein
MLEKGGLIRNKCENNINKKYEDRENKLSFSLQLSNINFKNYFSLIFKDFKNPFYIWLIYMVLLL